MNTVGIYRTYLAFEVWRWLCDRHVKVRRFAGWSCERTGSVTHECDDCNRDRNGGAS